MTINQCTVFPLIILILITFMNPLFAQKQKSATHHTYDGFRNPYPGFEDRGLGGVVKWMIWERLTGEKAKLPEKYDFPIEKNDGAFLRDNKTDFTATWIGHSTLLLQIEGMNILTDPVWSERASPFSFIGPKRFAPPGVALKDLPPIDVVLISHDHYDHLDRSTIEKLGNKPLYLIPLGVSEILERWGITNYEELDWWDSFTFNQTKFICTPTQHFSGRNPLQANSNLWASWVVKSRTASFYYGGDSGYFPGFAEIGQKYGPFDLAALPIGAYHPRWFMSPMHMSPDQAVQAFLDLQAKKFIPIHWGVFQMADEPLDEPPKVLQSEIARRELDAQDFLILKHGETRVIRKADVLVKENQHKKR